MGLRPEGGVVSKNFFIRIAPLEDDMIVLYLAGKDHRALAFEFATVAHAYAAKVGYQLGEYRVDTAEARRHLLRSEHAFEPTTLIGEV